MAEEDLRHELSDSAIALSESLSTVGWIIDLLDDLNQILRADASRLEMVKAFEADILENLAQMHSERQSAIKVGMGGLLQGFDDLEEWQKYLQDDVQVVQAAMRRMAQPDVSDCVIRFTLASWIASSLRYQRLPKDIYLLIRQLEDLDIRILLYYHVRDRLWRSVGRLDQRWTQEFPEYHPREIALSLFEAVCYGPSTARR